MNEETNVVNQDHGLALIQTKQTFSEGLPTEGLIFSPYLLCLQLTLGPGSVTKESHLLIHRFIANYLPMLKNMVRCTINIPHFERFLRTIGAK